MSEKEFRDGKRWVPDHLSAMMTGLDTSQYTYEEACRVADSQMLGGYLGRVQQGVVTDHFRRERDGTDS